MEVAFLAMSNHLNVTHSADFFIAHLREFFGQVKVIAHEQAWIELPRRHWDLIIAFQKLYSPEELEAFGADRVVLVPMYDACPHDEAFWERYRAFKVLCFSSALERLLQSCGVPTWGARYYPERPAAHAEWTGLRGFFWQRSSALEWGMVKQLCSGTRFEHMQVHWVPWGKKAPASPLDEEDARDPSIELSSWFADPAAFRSCLERSNVYFAPRLAEGIGHSFIEALALGQCVVAADRPTMNEYVTDGLTGILFDPSNPRPLDFSRARDLGLAARDSCAAGRQAWLASLPDIKRFLEEPALAYRPKAHPLIALRGRGLARLRKIPGLHALFRILRGLVRG